MAIDGAGMQPKRRSKLSPLLRWAQLALFTLFFADTYVYSMLDALLGRYLGTLGITQEHMALGYSIYGIAQLVGSIALLLLQSWRAAASIRLPTQYTLILVTVVTALGSTLLMVLAPASYQLLLVARALQGTMGAVYTIYAMTLLVQWFPPAWQMQAVAFMTAGQTSGDSLAPVLGAVLYDTRGIVSAYLTQIIIYAVALGAVVLLGVWWGVKCGRTGSSTPTHVTSPAQVSAGSETNTPSSHGENSGTHHLASTPPITPQLYETHGVSARGDASLAWCVDVVAHDVEADVAASNQRPDVGCRQAYANTTAVMPEAAGSTGTGCTTVWQVLGQWAVVLECGVVFLAQMVRAALDVLVPLAMYTTPTWVVGMVFLGEAAGALVAPFLLDVLLVHMPKISTRALQLAAVCCMAVSGPLVLLFHLSVPGAAVFFTSFGASHSIIEALAFKHLAEQVGPEESPGVLIAIMSAFSLFYVAGFTVGAFVAGAPQPDVVLQQLTLLAMSGGMLLYVSVYRLSVLLRRKCIASRRQ